MKSFLPLFIVAVTLAAPLRADLNSDLAFTSFQGQNVDLNALAGGQVMQARGPIMAFPRGITSQSLFVVDAQPADVARKLTTWNPASHSDLKVWLHQPLPSQPTSANFAALGSLPDNSSMAFQYKSTASFNPSSPSLQVNKEEAQLIASAAAQEKDPKALYVKVWSQILSGRIAAFLSGNGGVQRGHGGRRRRSFR